MNAAGAGERAEPREVDGGTIELRVFRGEAGRGRHESYSIAKEPGMVVLDAIHRAQARNDPTLACRWNCKAGKCGSCSAEINGRPRLMCMTRVDDLPAGEPVTVTPIRAFPHVKDLVADVSWNYEKNRHIQPFTPGEMTAEEKARGEFRMMQRDVDRVQEFRKCIECFLCQDVCHVLRDHGKTAEFSGPRFMIRIASLEMHPKDAADRVEATRHQDGVGMCNITKCCTEVCPEHIKITDNAIIPLKERVADRHHDPLRWAWRKIARR